ncbi:GspE/PulE family protein [Caulobacter sp. S45]|uniref:GspE/PulE family protein n=1 Tax=Caulobacter sp. S45 TaxID=1641861 RepID=UPI0020C7469C|nr:ATPase, T2SS/T4P/T4SS family [Caulobacter sp. S45]
MNAPVSIAMTNAPHAPPTDLHQLVAEHGLVAADALARARRVEQETGERLGSVLTRLGLVSEQRLAEAVSAATGLPIAAQADFPVEPVEAPGPLSPRFLRDAKAAPLRLTGETVSVAFVDPLDPYTRQALRVAFGRPVLAFVGRAGDIEAALDRAYGANASAEAADGLDADDADMERLKDLASDAPAIRAVNRLISEAVVARASDIHLEPSESALQVRLRIDGVMRELPPLTPAMRAAVVSRIKIMAGLNIAEKRLPQDGRARLTVRGHDVDIRVATSPTIHGESAVMRLLDRSHLTLDFQALGFDEGMLRRLRPVLAQPHGIMLVTGPTGSGKTTTLYTALSELNVPERKLLTIEDPIEYRLAGVNQTQVAPTIGLSFAAALRSFLRQDPDVIMVGEVRDLETAQVAVQAALTGHMILSTLHTNSAAAAVTRLIDMGVEPFLITSTLNAVLGQRLVRRLCPSCREPVNVEDRDLGLGQLGDGLKTIWRPVGCQDCAGSGYSGRIALTELLLVDEAISRLVLRRAEAQEIEREAVAAGMKTMLLDGATKVASGSTTVEEIHRVTREG